MSVEGVNATALRSLRCDSALMSALQRLSERIDPGLAGAARINSGTDILGFSTIRVRKLLPQRCLGQCWGSLSVVPVASPVGWLRNDSIWWT